MCKKGDQKVFVLLEANMERINNSLITVAHVYETQ